MQLFPNCTRIHAIIDLTSFCTGDPRTLWFITPKLYGLYSGFKFAGAVVQCNDCLKLINDFVHNNIWFCHGWSQLSSKK